ncbi:MAG: nucleoside phosphorylase [Candidatus Methanomethylicaceae archaeon]|nr:nucleoside phosphorylase [Candidatus Verstraetearchaeota archaeon]
MYHIKCSKEDIAERVIVCGDPVRVKKIAEFLDRPKLVNENRCLLTFTGEYKGIAITISTTGMGAPSAAIVMEELASLGVKFVIRVGTTGGVKLEVGDIVIPTIAIPLDGTTLAYSRKYQLDTHADVELIELLKENLRNCKFYTGPICTCDTFYLNENVEGVLSYDMESSIIFALGKIRGYRAASILVVNGKAFGNMRIVDNEEVKKSMEKCIIAALEALVHIKN